MVVGGVEENEVFLINRGVVVDVMLFWLDDEVNDFVLRGLFILLRCLLLMDCKWCDEDFFFLWLNKWNFFCGMEVFGFCVVLLELFDEFFCWKYCLDFFLGVISWRVFVIFIGICVFLDFIGCNFVYDWVVVEIKVGRLRDFILVLVLILVKIVWFGFFIEEYVIVGREIDWFKFFIGSCWLFFGVMFFLFLIMIGREIVLCGVFLNSWRDEICWMWGWFLVFIFRVVDFVYFKFLWLRCLFVEKMFLFILLCILSLIEGLFWKFGKWFVDRDF